MFDLHLLDLDMFNNGWLLANVGQTIVIADWKIKSIMDDVNTESSVIKY